MSRRLMWAPILSIVMLVGLWASVAGQSPVLPHGPVATPAPTLTPAPTPTPRIVPTGIGSSDLGVLVGVKDPVTLPPGSSASAVVGVQGAVTIGGHARVVVVVDAPVTITGGDAVVDTLVLIRADATLGPGSTVGTVRTLSSTITQDQASTVQNGIHDLKDSGILLVGLIGGFLVLLFIGWAIAVLVSGIVASLMAATQMRRMARSVSNEPLKVLGAGLVAIIAGVIVGGLLFVTIVGIPLAVLLWLLLGLAWFVGYLALGVWLGDLLLRRGHRPDDGKPVASMLLGLVLLLIAGFVPLVSLLAGWFALGTATLNGWRSLRARGSGAVPPETPAGPGTPAWVGAPTAWPAPVDPGSAAGTRTGWTPPVAGPPPGWGQPPVPPPVSGAPPGWGQPPVPPPVSGPPPGWGQPPQR